MNRSSNAFWIAFAAVAIAALAPDVTRAAPSIVIDAASGRVLHADQATDPWYPASTTKLMTAYVSLKAVQAGRVAMDTPLKVSSRAAAARPSKMGFKPGMELTLDNALKMLMVKSANDVAVTIAEGVGGSVEGFAELMNREAARLGMRESRFVNPNGWHDARNQTSARDLAILARAALADFPQHRDLWGIGAIQLGTRVYRNTNGLIGRYAGADGMKTGFVCASGFNVVSTATRYGRTLITVVLGAANGSERTATATQLFDKGFSDSGWSSGTSVESLPASASAGPPNMREQICGAGRRGAGAPTEEEDLAQPMNPAGSSENAALFFLQEQGQAPRAGGIRRATGNGPRMAFTPIRVFTGRAPGSDAAPGPATAIARGNVKPVIERPSVAASTFSRANRPVTASAGTPLRITDETDVKPGAAAGIRAKPRAKPAKLDVEEPEARPTVPKTSGANATAAKAKAARERTAKLQKANAAKAKLAVARAKNAENEPGTELRKDIRKPSTAAAGSKPVPAVAE